MSSLSYSTEQRPGLFSTARAFAPFLECQGATSTAVILLLLARARLPEDIGTLLREYCLRWLGDVARIDSTTRQCCLGSFEASRQALPISVAYHFLWRWVVKSFGYLLLY